MALRDYLAGEVVEDFADGHLTRREALARLLAFGLSVTSASALLAACSDGGDAVDQGTDDHERRAAASTTTPADASPSTTAVGAAGEEIRFAGPAGELLAVVAAPAGEPDAAILVVHENGGLTPYFRSFVVELANEGYLALCVDLVSRAGGTAAQGSAQSVQAALANASTADLVADLRAGLDELERRAPGVKLGAVGFCFGGAMTWNLLDAGEARLAAAIPFYGPAPADADFSRSRAAVLAIYAEHDARVNASREAATQALQRAGLVHETLTFRGVDHAFFNPTGRRYDEAAATEARAEMLAWFDTHL